MSKAVATRTVGEIPASIATAQAIAALFGELEGVPKPKTLPILEFDEVWINIRTMMRNIDGAIQSGALNDASPRAYYEALFSEIQIITSKFGLLGDKSPKLHFYTLTYKHLNQFWPNAVVKDVTAPKVQEFMLLEKRALEHVAADIHSGALNKNTVLLLDTKLPVKGKKALLLSHFAVDLLLSSGSQFEALVESHTGAIKRKADWNTKLRDGKKYPRIPFDACTVQIFGDGAGLLAPQPAKMREALVEISVRNKWNSLTTRERVIYCTELFNDPILTRFVKKCY